MMRKQSNCKVRKFNKKLLLAHALTILIISSCETTFQVRSTETSGFLGDYSQLKEGTEDDEALLFYINPATEFKNYDKILFEPISVYAEQDSDLIDLPKEDVQSLLNYFDSAIREQLKSDYSFVIEPGLGAMRLRVAITETEDSMIMLDTISSVIPVGIAASAIKKVATGTHMGVGNARVETEILDSETGERLVAFVDERAGSKYTGRFDKWKKWQDAKDAYDYWANLLKIRLAELSSRE